MAIDGAVAGGRGVPVIFVASDDKGVAEAHRFFPHIESVTTKQALGWNAAISKHPRRTVQEIYDGVQKAVARLDEMQPFRFDEPLTFQIRFKRLEAAQAASRNASGWRRLDAYTVERTLATIEDYF
jgi:D-amino peptidase